MERQEAAMDCRNEGCFLPELRQEWVIVRQGLPLGCRCSGRSSRWMDGGCRSAAACRDSDHSQ
jgi:hypothetical protein